MSLLSVNLAVITLIDDVPGPSIDNTSFSNLSTWTLGSNDTTDSQSSSAFVFRNILLSTNYTILSPVFSPVITEVKYGQNFKVNVRITITSASSADVVVQAIPLLSGASGAVFSNTVNVTPNSGAVDVDFLFDTNGASFDQIRLDFTNGDGAVYVTTIATVTSLEFTDTIGTLDIGDRIYCKWIPSLSTQQTYLQDNPSGGFTAMTFGPDLPDTAIGTVIGIDTGDPDFKSLYSTCAGTTLKEWAGSYDGMSFPYMIETDTPNSAFCSVSGITCSLTFTPPFTINGPTNAYTFDGNVQLTSDGANGTPKYSDTDDLYSVMSNTSGYVSGLAPGTYTFYTRDIYNCRDTVEVVIPNTYVYNVLYRVESYGITDHKAWRMDILERGYSGAVNEIHGGAASPFALSKNQGEVNNKFDVIRNTRGNITLLSRKHFQFIGLFSQDDQKFKVNSYKDYGSGLTLEWTGFITPSLFSEVYQITPYPTSITCTDNLTVLNDDDFLDDAGNHFMGTLKLIKIIALILKKTGLSINIYCGINKFAEGHSTGGNNDPLDQTYIDCASFYDEDGAPWKCSRVIEAILAPFGAFLIQQSGVWWLIELEAQYTSYNYRVFNSDGVVQSNSSFDPIQQINGPSYMVGQVFSEQDAKLNIVPAYGTVTIKHSLLTKHLFSVSMDADWQVSTAGTLGYAQFYDIPDSTRKGVGFLNLDAGVPTTNSPSTIPFYNFITWLSPEFPVTTLNDSIKIGFEYKPIFDNRYDPDLDPGANLTFNPPWLEYRWRLTAVYNSVVYYFSEIIGWTSDITFEQNKFYIETLQNTWQPETIDFNTFSKEILLPIFVDPTEIVLQFTLFFSGSIPKHFSDSAGLKAIPTANVLPIGARTTGVTTTAFQWWELRSGTDAEILNTIYRPDDYNATTNPVVWEAKTEKFIAGFYATKFTQEVRLQNIIIDFFPDYSNPITEEVQEQTLNELYKENTEVTLEAGDIPTAINSHQIYANIFRYSNGTPTKNWAQPHVGVFIFSIQELLMQNYETQYTSPSWNINGSLLGYTPFKFNQVIKQVIAATTITLVNQEFATMAGWVNFGGGVSWAASSGNTKVAVTVSGTSGSKYLIQSATVDIISGIHISISSSIQRTASAGSRADEFIVALLKNGQLVQTETFAAFTEDAVVTDTIDFYTQNDADTIGFFVNNFSSPSNPAVYEVDYFRVSGLATTRYYYPDSLSRDERQNINSASLVQIFPTS